MKDLNFADLKAMYDDLMDASFTELGGIKDVPKSDPLIGEISENEFNLNFSRLYVIRNLMGLKLKEFDKEWDTELSLTDLKEKHSFATL